MKVWYCSLWLVLAWKFMCMNSLSGMHCLSNLYSIRECLYWIIFYWFYEHLKRKSHWNCKEHNSLRLKVEVVYYWHWDQELARLWRYNRGQSKNRSLEGFSCAEERSISLVIVVHIGTFLLLKCSLRLVKDFSGVFNLLDKFS